MLPNSEAKKTPGGKDPPGFSIEYFRRRRHNYPPPFEGSAGDPRHSGGPRRNAARACGRSKKTGPATAIVASRSLHGAILSQGAKTPHKRVDEKGTNTSISNALSNCNPLRMKREDYFLNSFLRPMPARPTRPRPISTMVPGSGTGAACPVTSAKIE